MPLRTRALALLLLALTACTSGPIAWDDDAAAVTAPPTPPVVDPPADSARCPGSLVATRSGGDEYAAWWRARTDGSAALVAAHRARGAAWDAPVLVDSADQSHDGCDRPPPAAAADSASGYVHLVYFLVAPEGAGVFFSHSMDRGAMYHSAVGVVYGDAPSSAAVAARGDTVVVAYEDPGRDPERGVPVIGLAASITAGHIFETRGVAVTSGDTPSTNPAIALAPGGRLTVWWDERGARGGPPQRRARSGRLR